MMPVADSLRSLAQRVVSGPNLHDAAAARARLDDWLAEIGTSPAGTSVRQLFAELPTLHALMLGLTDGSPYLWELVRRSPERLVDLLQAEPERRFDDILHGAKRAIAVAREEAEAMRVLRHMKAEAALLIALGDIGGLWPITKVIDLQTRLADTAVSAAVDYLIGDAQRRGKLKIFGPAQQPPSYIVLAMGKMGAGERTYSSDLDLIVFYADTTLASDTDPAPFYVRLTRALIRLLQERTWDGYVFRTDLRLRPDPGSTQIVLSTAAALHYYETRGQNWERAALIKARPCAGDLAAGEALLTALSPFIWRKYLDFAAVADVHALKRQIHVYRGHDEIAVEGHNIKLGRGGIREIEFFVQTQQLIAGGRHPELRTRGTVETLERLAKGGWIAREAARELTEAYLFLRRIENRLQMVGDQQTHIIPADQREIDRVARLSGFADTNAFGDALVHAFKRVETHYGALFEKLPEPVGPASILVVADEGDPAAVASIERLGFCSPSDGLAAIRAWQSGRY